MTKKIAVLLAGCGCSDGSEIHEVVLTLLSIKQHGANYECFSIDEDQNHVTNHALKEVSLNEKRNMLIESARIARCEIKVLSSLNISDYDGVIIPGGYGVAYNFCDFALKGKDFTVREDVANICRKFTEMAKPAGFICIAPIMIARIYQNLCQQNQYRIKMTLGNDQQIAEIVNSLGMQHIDTPVSEACVDKTYKIVTTPAYMLAKNPAEVYSGINQLVIKLLELI